MNEKKKLKLTDLKIKSFLTNLEDDKQKKVLAGGADGSGSLVTCYTCFDGCSYPPHCPDAGEITSPGTCESYLNPGGCASGYTVCFSTPAKCCDKTCCEDPVGVEL
ncbi:MAG: hypothetical protein GY940_19410 [bacterium]|nr:hypothetical protein [bacterium]